MARQPLSVAEAVPKAVDDLGADADRVAIHIPDELAEIYADPALLERILANLLSNAVRHSPPDQPPAITASEHAGTVEIRVIDHGPGIPVADRDRVFLPFQRLGDRNNDTGVGLGLALSRGLAEVMGGSLDPETTPGGGLTMTLRLPTADTAADPDQAPDPAALDRIDNWRQEVTPP